EAITRLAAMMGDFQALEKAKGRAAEMAAMKELDEIERRKNEELSHARNLDEHQAIREHYQEVSAMVAPVAPPPAKPHGQIVREDWKIEVTDIWLLARMHPACVKIEPRLPEIKSILNSGHKVAGVRAERVTMTSARTS